MPSLLSPFDATCDWAIQRQISLHEFQQTLSTNDEAKAQALQQSEKFSLYLADHQTAGRGRGTNSWLDTGRGEALLSSWSWAVTGAPQPVTAPRFGLKIHRAAASVWPSLAWSLKAPNDIYLNGKKCGGLLVESLSDGQKVRLILGFGFNVLNHPRSLEATHLSEGLQRAPYVGEWFQFLDELHSGLSEAAREAPTTTLSPKDCENLLIALNTNVQKAHLFTLVTPQGDLIHAGGKIRWMDL